MTIRYKLKRDELDWVDAPSETVILDHASEQYMATNPAGSTLWNALEEARTQAELADLLVEIFEIDKGRAEADVAAFLEELKKRGLIEEVS